MKHILLTNLLKEETFTAIRKDSGKVAVFKTKDARDAAIKAGTHSETGDGKENPKGDKPNMFSKDSGYDAPDIDNGDEKSDSNDDDIAASEEVAKAIKNKSGTSVVSLFRKNKNGKLVQDVEFRSDEITPEQIRKVAEKYGIDLKSLVELGLDTKVKTKYDKVTVAQLITDLIMSDVKANQYAPGEVAEDDYYYKVQSDSTNETAAVIKKLTKPKEVKPTEPTKSTTPSDDSKYTEESVKDFQNIFLKLKKDDKLSGFGIDEQEFSPKAIAATANKYKIDIDRIINNPDVFFEITGLDSSPEFLKSLGYDTKEEYILAKLAKGVHFRTDADMADLAELAMAYPLKHKNLSDEEWRKEVENEKTNPTSVSSAIRNFNREEADSNKDWKKVARENEKKQADWVKTESKKNPNYHSTMIGYQQYINKGDLNKIDELIKSTPPPPIKAKALYRGMAMKTGDFNNFIKSFNEGEMVDLPIGSFSMDPSVATGFSDNVDNDNATIDKSHNQSVMIKIVNSKDEFNGFAMNSNIDNAEKPEKPSGGGGFGGMDEGNFANWASQEEVLLPSNNKYKVLSVETKKLEGGRTFTVITLELIGIKTEIKLREFIDTKEKDMFKKHLQYPNRLSLLYKKEK